MTSKPPLWSVVALLWPVALLNYLDRQMLATMGLSIQADIVEMQSAEKFGQVMAVFLWVYALCSPLSGFVADRFNRKWLIVASLAIWSSVTLLMGRVNDFSDFYWLRAIMGISEAVYIPASLALIADCHRGPTRSLAIGIHTSGIYAGQALGGVGGWIAQDISWRAAFSYCGALGVIYSLVLIFLLREHERDRNAPRPAEPVAKQMSGLNQLRFVFLMLAFALPSFSGWAVKNWLPTLLQDRFQLLQKPSGLLATMSSAGASFGGVLFGGWLSDLWIRRNLRGRVWASALGLALTTPALIGIGLAPGLAQAVACTALFGIGWGMFDANNMPILCQIAPPRFRATGYGILNFAGISAGAYLTPLLGKLKDHGVPLSTGFAVCAIPSLVAAGFMLAVSPGVRDCGSDEISADR